jgi:iron complex transport system permease protein
MPSNAFILAGLAIALATLILASAATGEIAVPFGEAMAALAGGSTEYTRSLIHNLRLPRILAGAAIGVALSVSGLLSSTALRNPLADSGILGIQSGATVGALLAILVLPGFAPLLPLFAFVGGLAAYAMLIAISSGSGAFQPTRVVLIGVAINAVATSVIGIITILNVYRVRDALSWLNGSLATVSRSQMGIILWYTLAMGMVAALLIPVLKILLLEDGAIINLGHRPALLRLIVSLAAVFLAGISVAYAGVITFVGIIAPQLAKRMVGQNFTWLLPASALIGANLVVATDLFQRAIFAPMEIPVGILIGVLGAPMFIVLSRRA